jgi:endonuclease/exonuclease/phosphatase (EEP) superfamily protein YafD
MRAVFLVLAGCSSAVDPTPPAPLPKPPPDPAPIAADAASQTTVRVASYNVNVALPRESSAAAIEAIDADIVLLQEVGRDWQAILEKRFAAYPHVSIDRWDRQRWGGLAVLSRYPFRDAELLPPRRGPFPAWRAVFATPLGDIEILNVHLYPPIRLSRKSGWLDAYREGQVIHVDELESFFGALGDGPALIAGDLNEDSFGAGVRWLGERGFTRSARRPGGGRPRSARSNGSSITSWCAGRSRWSAPRSSRPAPQTTSRSSPSSAADSRRSRGPQYRCSKRAGRLSGPPMSS